jgi:hypothetical protein
MLPPITAVNSIEMIRDGGSLQAEFVGTNGSSYCLHFKLISKDGSTGELARVGYEHPVVYERLEFREGNRVEWQAINQVDISWAHAKVLLHQLRDLLKSEEDSKWLSAMEEVANTDGQVPRNMPRVLQSAHQLLRDA